MDRSQPENAATTPASATADDPLRRVLDVVRFLRLNCPWDAAQTPRSLLPYLLEEAHEVAEAVEIADEPHLATELGDLLLHVAFQIALAEERGAFDGDQVASAVIAKMRRRHAHLFQGEGEGEGEGEEGEGQGEGEEGEGEGEGNGVMDGSAREWEAIKARERPGRSLVDGIAAGLDPLSRAHRIQERVSSVGFDWSDPDGALEKVREETEEVAEALQSSDELALEMELGDLLFAVVNLARLAGTHGMHALSRANRKFGDRFRALERLAAERDIVLRDATLAELDLLWEEIKHAEQGG